MKINKFQLIPTIGQSVRFVIEFDKGKPRDFQRSMDEDISRTIKDILFAYQEVDNENLQLKKEVKKLKRKKKK